LIDLGWLDTEEKVLLKDGITWAEILQKMTGAEALSDKYVTLPKTWDMIAQTYDIDP
jgi:hypothetical protein